MSTPCSRLQPESRQAVGRGAACLVVRRRWTRLAMVLAVCVAGSGAGCPRMMRNMGPQLPRALPPNATLDQVLALLNQNSGAIQSFSSTRARLSTPGAPAIDANLVFQRDRNFRLRGGTTFTGPEVDLGSNQELFWFWVKRNVPPALYFCRHQQFAASRAKESLPIEPDWLIKALGIVSFDASEQHQGPYAVRGGRLEIRSTQPGVPNAHPRVTVIDDARGVILEQHVYDERGSLLATASLSQHSRDPATGIIMPRRVQVRWPPAQFEMTIEFYDLAINRVVGDPQELYTKPTYPGYPDVDLADPRSLAPPPNAGVSLPPANGIPTLGYPSGASATPAMGMGAPLAPEVATNVAPYNSIPETMAPTLALPGSPPVYTPEPAAPAPSGTNYGSTNVARTSAWGAANVAPASTGTLRRASLPAPPLGAVPRSTLVE